MCSSPKMPKMKDPEPLPAPEPVVVEPLPPPEPLPQPKQVNAPMQAAPPPPPQQVAQQAPMAPVAPQSSPQAPPPQLVQNPGVGEDTGIVKKRKSKRKELQQASSGTDALRIPLEKSIGSTAKGTTGTSGLNIPR